jgi:large subunit ribosomal protein L11
MAKKKEIQNVIKLQIQGGRATPAPPLGPILGQNGIAIPDFCNQFNEKTREKGADLLPVVVTVYKDRSFTMVIHEPTMASMVKKAAGIDKGSANPKKDKVGKIRRKQLREIAERKMPDLNTSSIESAMKTAEGTARSLGLEIID